MRRSLLLVAVCALVPAAVSAQSLADRLAALAPGDWLSYRVPLQPEQRAGCCFDWRGSDVDEAVCRLDAKNWNFGHRGDEPPPEPGARLRVLLRKGDEGFDRVHALAESCQVDAAGARVAEAGELPAEESIALLAPAMSGGRTTHRHEAAAAIAHHAGGAADRALERAAAPGQPRAQRRDALFWLAQARGEIGFGTVRRQVQSEGDDELRRHLVFLHTISKVPAATRELRLMATTHADGDMRGEAMFWLSQQRDPQAEAIIRNALAKERSRAVLDKAVFALSQLPAERAIPALRALLEEGQDRHIRKQALFWLAQVDDDAVLPLFDRLLDDGRD